MSSFFLGDLERSLIQWELNPQSCETVGDFLFFWRKALSMDLFYCGENVFHLGLFSAFVGATHKDGKLKIP